MSYEETVELIKCIILYGLVITAVYYSTKTKWCIAYKGLKVSNKRQIFPFMRVQNFYFVWVTTSFETMTLWKKHYSWRAFQWEEFIGKASISADVTFEAASFIILDK